MELKIAGPEDELLLRNAFSNIETGNSDLRLRRIIHNDFFAKVNAHKNPKVIVAQQGEEIAGSGAFSFRSGMLNGKPGKIGYLFNLFVAEKYRRQGVARELTRKLEEELKDGGVDLIFLAVQGGNTPIMNLLSQEGFELYRKVANPGFAVTRPKELSGPFIVKTGAEASRTDLEAATALVNKTWAEADLFEPYTVDSLEELIDRMPGVALENLLLLENEGKIRACIAYWDPAELISLHVESTAAKLKMMRAFGSILKLFRPMPRIPRPGDTLRPACSLGFLGFDEVSHFEQLIHQFNNIALEKEIEMVFFICELNDPLTETLNGFFRFDSHINIYTKTLHPETRLNGGRLYVDAFEVF